MTGTVHVQCFEFWGNVRVNLVALVDNCGSSNYTSSLVSAISRSLLLKLDQAYIAVQGGWEHIISLMYFWLARIKSCDGPP